jgi:hypothetical protein
MITINNIAYYSLLALMCILVIISLGLSGYAMTTHSTLIKILDVGNNLINDVTITGDLQVTQNMNCQTQLVTKTECIVKDSITTNTLHIANSMTLEDQIMTKQDAVLFVNSSEFVQVSQDAVISFAIPMNGSATTIKIPMNNFTYKFVSGEPSFYQLNKNTTQQTVRLLSLPSSTYSISFRASFTISAQPIQAVSLQASIVAYDTNMIYGSLTNNGSAVIGSFTSPLDGKYSFVINRQIDVPVFKGFTSFGIQILLLYSHINNLDSPTITFPEFLLDAYRNT